MAKTLCDWSRKDIAKRSAELAGIVSQPRFVCGKCARVAGVKGRLCRPVKLALGSPIDFEATRVRYREDAA